MSNNTQQQLRKRPAKRKRNNTANVPYSKLPQMMNATNPALAMTLARPAPPRRRANKKRKRANRNGNVPFMKHAHFCSAKYASALLDPEYTPLGACVPFGFPQATKKSKGFTTGRMACGTSGVGYVLANASTVNDVAVCTYTGATSVGTTATALNAFTNLGTALQANLPYAAASVGASGTLVQTRLVSQILKVRYAGTEANRNGSVYCVENPIHGDISAMTPSQVFTMPARTNARPKMDGSWHTVLWSGPVAQNEAVLGVTSTFASRTGYAGIVILGTAGDIYDFEVYTQIEYAGQIDGTGPAEADAEGYTAIISTVKNALTSTSLDSDAAPTLFRQAMEAIGVRLRSYAFEQIKDYVSENLHGMPNTRLLEL